MASRLLDLAALLPSWQLAMRAERKSPGTIKTYTAGVHRFLRWCAKTDHRAELTKATVQAFMADLLNNGAESNTAASRRTALKRFVAWLVDGGELNADPLLGLKAPKSDHKVVHALTDDELRRLLKACQGRSLRDRRDAAIVRLTAEIGMRASKHRPAGRRPQPSRWSADCSPRQERY
jgi:integrase/recombinase XerD